MDTNSIILANANAMRNVGMDYGASAGALNTKPQSSSDVILSRLNAIRANLQDARSGIGDAADKIVGAAPTIQQTGSALGQIKGEPASCFLDALQQVISDIEIIGAEAHEHLNRLHRSF